MHICVLKVWFYYYIKNNKGANKNGQSRETDNIGHTRQRKTQHNVIKILFTIMSLNKYRDIFLYMKNNIIITFQNECKHS
jgi:hypothetical protein